MEMNEGAMMGDDILRLGSRVEMHEDDTAQFKMYVVTPDMIFYDGRLYITS